MLDEIFSGQFWRNLGFFLNIYIFMKSFHAFHISLSSSSYSIRRHQRLLGHLNLHTIINLWRSPWINYSDVKTATCDKDYMIVLLVSPSIHTQHLLRNKNMCCTHSTSSHLNCYYKFLSSWESIKIKCTPTNFPTIKEMSRMDWGFCYLCLQALCTYLLLEWEARRKGRILCYLINVILLPITL